MGSNPYVVADDLSGRADGKPPWWGRDTGELMEDGTHPSDDGTYVNGYLDGRYFRVGVSWNGAASLKMEKRHYSTYDMQYSFADTQAGPWPRARAGSVHGNGMVFKDARGRYWSTFFSNDCSGPYEGNWGGIYPVTVDKSSDNWRVDIADEMPEDCR